MNQAQGTFFSPSTKNVINEEFINDEFHKLAHITPVGFMVSHPSNPSSIHQIPRQLLLWAKQHALHQTASESFMMYLQLIGMKATAYKHLATLIS